MSDDEEVFARRALAKMLKLTDGQNAVDEDATETEPVSDVEPWHFKFRPRTKKAETRDPLPAGMRFDVLSRDDFTCQACGARPGNENLNVDHLLPWSKGGAHHLNNLTTLCRGCNNGKGARMYVPRRQLLTDYDAQGYAVWKRFGSWEVQVCSDGVVADWPKDRGYTWFGIERCWEDTWIDHFSRKCVHRGCDENCPEVTRDDMVGPPTPWQLLTVSDFLSKPKGREYYHSMGDLADALDFMRSIYRRDAR